MNKEGQMIHLYKSILIILAAAMLTACDQQPDSIEDEPLRLVRTLTITPPDNDNLHEFSGVVEAAREAELSFRVAGKLKKLAVKEGDRVEKDQLLAQLDPTDYEIQLKSHKAEFSKAEADFQRAKQLIETDVISRSNYEQLKMQRDTSSSTVAAAQQKVTYTSLKAPFSGRIATRHVENFEEVGAKQKIYTLHDPTAFTIKVDIPESIMIRAKEDAKPEVYAVFSQFPERKFPLTISEVSTQADAQTNTFAVSLNMPATDDLNILPGMSVTVRAKPHSQRQISRATVLLPAHTVLEDDEGRFVYVVKPTGDNRGLIEKRSVSVGELMDSGLQIESGLQVGDEVVSAGMSKMSTGLEVRLPKERSQ